MEPLLCGSHVQSAEIRIYDPGPHRVNPAKETFFSERPDGENLNFWDHIISQNELSLSFSA